MENIFARQIKRVGQLFDNVNSAREGVGDQEGTQEYRSELALDMSDEELLDLSKMWAKDFDTIKGKWHQRAKANYLEWKGESEDINDNVIFESIETWLPMAARQLPTPVVLGPDEEKAYELADSMQKQLVYVADIEKLKVKLKEVLRHWCIDLLGVMKIGWDFEADEIKLQTVDPKDLIMGAHFGYDVSEYKGEYIGQRKTESASTLIERFPDKKKDILAKTNNKRATKITYTEWWTNDYLFYTYENILLGKYKNPHWNYDGERQITDEYGEKRTVQEQGSNHFKQPKMPFVFFSVYAFDNPFDQTSLIEQAKGLQEVLNKRAKQVDQNADSMNNGIIVNNQISVAQAKELANSLRKGGVVRAPTENINDSVQRWQPTPLPSFIYDDMLDKRNEIKNIIGVRGSTAQGILSERTVQGKIEIKGQDVDRSVGITDYLEQFTDYVFNWMTQMIYVYYTEEHTAAIIGKDNATQYTALKSDDLKGVDLRVSVKEGSMIPKDPLTRRNEAIDLWAAGATDPVSLFEDLDAPDPRESAKRLIQYQTDPQAYLQEMGIMEPEPEIPQLTPGQAPPPDITQLLQ